MASFVVMERRAVDGERDVEFVRDGFHLLAFLFPLFWFLFHRMWIEAAVTLALIVTLAVITAWAGYPAHWPLSLLVSVFAGLEAPTLRLAAMRRTGWSDRGVIEAADNFGAEARYRWDMSADEPESTAGGEEGAFAGTETARAPRAAPGPALGLFSYPDGR